MRFTTVLAHALGAGLALSLAMPLARAQAGAPASAAEPPLLVLSPKAAPPGWSGVHRPHTKLADVLARHAGVASWAETVVDDESLVAQWVSMAPGEKTPRRMNGDTREWWIVQSGTLRFTVEGREPARCLALRARRSPSSPRRECSRP